MKGCLNCDMGRMTPEERDKAMAHVEDLIARLEAEDEGREFSVIPEVTEQVVLPIGQGYWARDPKSGAVEYYGEDRESDAYWAGA